MANPDSDVRQLLADLRDFDKTRRRTAVYKLGMIGGDEAVRALMQAVRNDNEDLIVRGRAALMLGKLKDQRAVDDLIDALDAPGYQTPLHAAEALGRIGDARAIEPLVAMVDTHLNDRARNAAREALRRLGHALESDELETEDLVGVDKP